MHTAAKRLFAALALAGLSVALASCSAAQPAPSAAVPTDPPTVISQTPSPSVQPTPEPTPEPTSEPTPEPSPEVPSYVFGTPLEETEPVEDDSFFDSAVFLGDSRTEGFQLFSGLKHGDFYWARGMTVFRVDDPKYSIFEIDGEQLTMIGALGKKQYDAVYIMVGINELGYGADQFHFIHSFLLLNVIIQFSSIAAFAILPVFFPKYK